MNNQFEEILREKYCLFRQLDTDIALFKEVPVYSRSVDLVEYNTSTNELFAVEFKINNWRRALSQLNGVAMCFDYLVLCIPKPKTERCTLTIKETCMQIGVGLYLWDNVTNSFIHECDERNMHDIWGIQKKQIVEYLKKQETNDE